MIIQFDIENNTIVHKWYSLTNITQKTSYDADSIKKAIEEKKQVGGYAWIEWNNK